MIKRIFLSFFLFSFFYTNTIAMTNSLDYTLIANKNFNSKYHFFYSQELGTSLLALEKEDSTIALYQYMDDRKWKPISNARAYDGYPEAGNIFPNMRYDKTTGTISVGAMSASSSLVSPKAVNADAISKTPNSTVIMNTTQGIIELELFNSLTPKTVENFLFLSSYKLYDNLTFHRIIDKFMIQGGDPSGNGTGSMSKWGDKFEDEFVDSLKFDKPYLLAMANSGPNTNGSQFFITLNAQNTKHLTGKHTIFGRVVSGFKVIDRLAKVEVGDNDAPIIKQEIISIRIKK